MRLPIALRLDGGHILAAELSLAQLSRQMRQMSQGDTVAYLATRAGKVLAQSEPLELSPDERSLVAAGGGGRATVRADGERWLAATAPVGSWSSRSAKTSHYVQRRWSGVTRYSGSPCPCCWS